MGCSEAIVPHLRLRKDLVLLLLPYRDHGKPDVPTQKDHLEETLSVFVWPIGSKRKQVLTPTVAGPNHVEQPRNRLFEARVWPGGRHQAVPHPRVEGRHGAHPRFQEEARGLQGLESRVWGVWRT